ncbi:ubiquinol oxidase subunit II [Gallibacterium anatis]|uniref:Ubiquinol oxidase subunit 2 n=1 Tax=Gallibacterium anatis TaxID=750 RepID=A0A1A7NRA3_9PAST|nr:ubiquinol oxidase subunit II [Gallibacterium anatis]KGQ39453.1 ubiquinol oxidase subunit II [Gallibacterium anatis]KGQ55071.1 ubiquinol oxidase subunit II [Gallibacterium anatis DSM 16844 = F 149]OBW92742.1 ubiquinol oxidase subunit II [Gallibacterium anatis]OBW98313.1 ubiquinol oxidase subunit II [Gallibacterium anatis]STO38264.1 Ubiquinol oxidase subunit 2 precursor [Gallibacterium anatis]
MKLSSKQTKWSLVLICAAFLLSGCENAVLLNPKGQIGMAERDLILIATGLMLLVVIPVIIMAIVFARKYRESNVKEKYSPNWAHSNKIEMVVWGIPVIIILILGTITWKTTHSLDPYRPLEHENKSITIQVVSLDWKWLFIYPEQGIATVNEIAFPQNTPVEFKITSDTVMNSFFIPQLGSQVYAMAGMQTKLHLIADEPGTYKGISASYSGSGFSGMKFNAIATPDEASFADWVAKVKQSPDSLNTMDAYNQVAIPSKYDKPKYFSSVVPNLFYDIMAKFGSPHMHKPDMQGHSTHISHNESSVAITE